MRGFFAGHATSVRGMAYAPDDLARVRVLDGDGVLEGQELRDMAALVTRALGAAGVREGDVVGLALAPARVLLPALVAAWQIGATVVLVPPALGAAELGAVASGLAPAVLVTDTKDAARIAAATGGSASTFTAGAHRSLWSAARAGSARPISPASPSSSSPRARREHPRPSP